VVVGAFDVPFGHLAFDEPRVGARAAFGELFGEDFSDRLLMGGGEALGGKIPGGIWCCGGRLGDRG
jgi:hypothetical protein